MVSTPSSRQAACSARNCSLRASKASSELASQASSAIDSPTVRVASAARTRRASSGEAAARSQCSRSRASSLAKTESLSDRYTEATPRRRSARRTSAASRPLRTSTAMSAGRRRWKSLPGAWKPARSSLSQATMRSAQRAANRRRTSPVPRSARSWWMSSAGATPPSAWKTSSRPFAATGSKGRALSAASRKPKAPAPGRASACANQVFTALTSARAERKLVPSM